MKKNNKTQSKSRNKSSAQSKSRGSQQQQSDQKSSLQALFVHELRDIYNAEKQILRALPKLAKKAFNEDLKAAFEEHIEQTEGQVERLDQVFESLGEKVGTSVKCKGMEGLLAEGEELLQEGFDNETLDAGLICAAQKVEHYEIAAYGTLCTFAEILGHEDAKELLGETLSEEEETDERLTELAESHINYEAMESESEESEEESEEEESEEMDEAEESEVEEDEEIKA